MQVGQTKAKSASRLAGMTFVLLLHLALGYALVTGLARTAIEVIKQPFETRIVEEIKPPQDQPPPPPPPKLAPPPPFVPPPEVNIQVQAPTQNVVTAVSRVAPPPEAPPAPPAPPAAPAVEAPRQPVRVPPVVQAKSCKTPEYPAASRRLQEAGTVTLSFLIGADGRVLESKVASSSGFPRLDEAARYALGLCNFTPGAVDGKPEQSWHQLKYVWQLER